MQARALRRAIPALVLAAAASSPAQRAAAVTLPFTATVQIELLSVVTSFTGSGVATVNGSGAGTHVASIDFAAGMLSTGGLVIDVTDPGAAPVRGIQVTVGNGAGHLAETAMGTLRGVMPLLGVAKICLFGTCDGAVANVSVPLSVIGVGGRGVATGPVNVTVEGAPWTTGTARNFLPFTPRTSMRTGFAKGPASLPSSTGAPGGSIQLVTPYVVWTNLGVDQPSVFGFVTTTLHFVPEPATLAMLAGGCIVLGVRARRRAVGA